MKKIFLTFFFLSVSPILFADPWFTGPLLANPALVVPLGTANWQMFDTYSDSSAIYAYNHQVVPTPTATTNTGLFQLSYGLSSDVDYTLDVDYFNNRTQGKQSHNLGDTLMTLGFQILRQGDSNVRPDLRIMLEELFPTGRWDNLNSQLSATDATGAGSYQTSIGFNFGLLSSFSELHALYTTLNLIATFPSSVHLTGESMYGGSPFTRGKIFPGNALTFILSGEYSLNQNWVVVLEGQAIVQQASKFNGTVGPNPSSFTALASRHFTRRHGILAAIRSIRPTNHDIFNTQNIGSGNFFQLSFDPSIEYNFTPQFGVLGAVWFTTMGKNSPQFSAVSFTFEYTF